MSLIYDPISGDSSALESSGVLTPLADIVDQGQNTSPVLDIGYTIKTDTSAPYLSSTNGFNWWLIVLLLALYYLYTRGR